LYKESTGKCLIGLSKTALGAVYIALKNYEQAETALKEAIKVLGSDLYERGMAMLYLNQLYARLGKKEDARKQMQNAKGVFDKIGLSAKSIKEQLHFNKQ